MNTSAVPGARTLVLDIGASVLRGRSVTPQAATWPAKDPGEVLGYAADFAALTGGQPIAQLDVAVQPAGSAVVVQAAANGTLAVLLLGGGVDGQAATIVASVTLPDGERVVRALTLPIVAQAASAAPLDPTALLINGFALTFGGVPLQVGP